jgi:hypothetical protein
MTQQLSYGIYPKELKRGFRHIPTNMFIVAQFMILKGGNNQNVYVMDKQVDKLWCMHTIDSIQP